MEILTPTSSFSNIGIYWVNLDKIQCSNLDGSEMKTLITGLNYPKGIALDVSGGKIYWATSSFPYKIQCFDLDCSDVQDLVVFEMGIIECIALDVSGGKMYWTNAVTGKIQCSNLDGSNMQNLAIGEHHSLCSPRGMALDIDASKMYWADWRGKIRCSNLDGSNMQNLVTDEHGLYHPWDIALDVSGGKMYWTDEGTGKIQCSNLDASNMQDLVVCEGPDDVPISLCIALDVSANKIYWTDGWGQKIQCSNLDGSNIRDVVTPYGLLEDIALCLAHHLDDSNVLKPVTNVERQAAVSFRTAPQNLLSESWIYWVG